MHFPNSAFTWTSSSESATESEDLGDIPLFRCAKCRSCAACRMGTGPNCEANWAIRGAHLARDEDGKIVRFKAAKISLPPDPAADERSRLAVQEVLRRQFEAQQAAKA